MSPNAFHPAVHGILEAARTQHEQARALMRVAGDETVETVERYSEIIDGLTRLISIATPTEYGILPASGLEKVRGAYQIVGRLLTALADFELSSWSFGSSNDVIDAMLSRNDAGARTVIREIAERIDVPYIERRHGTTGNTLMIAAEGAIDGVSVRIWKLITAERPFCDRHHRMLTEADVCEECENPGIALSATAADDEADNPFEIADGTRAAFGLTAVDEAEHYDAAEADDVRQIRHEMDIDAGDDSEALRQEAEDDASNERFAAALRTTTKTRRAQARHDRAIACDGSCGGEIVCAFGPHDPITTPSTTEPEEAPHEP